jgi:hypothetical protein
MGIRTQCLSVIVFCVIFVSTANAIELKPSKKAVSEAIKFGEAHSDDIFSTPRLKQAIYGNWPNSDGGFVKSKLTLITVLAAMNARRDKKLTEEEINEILKSDELQILGNAREELGSFPKDVSVELKQGNKVIKPKELKQGVKMRDNWTSVYAIFPYSTINPKAKTTIIFKVNSREREYKLDFSKIK